jgi:ribulose bisphosphate carboxylase small subunit
MLSIRRLTLPLMLLTVLAACGTPQEQCINRSTRELRTLERLLAEVEGNLARGYAWEEYEVVRTRWEVCGYSEQTRSDGTVVRHPRMCLEDYTDTLRRRVPIDPAAEQRKRDGLIAKRAQAVLQAEANIKACKVAYPE